MASRIASLALFAIALMSGISAHAATVTGSIDIVGVMSDEFNYDLTSPNLSYTEDGKTFTLTRNEQAAISGASTMNGWTYDWTITASTNPFIESSFSVTNQTASTQTFDLFFSLPVSTTFAPGFKSGELNFTFTDANGDGSASVVLNSWDGLIDGVSALQLFTASIPCSGTGCSGGIAPVSTGPVLHSAGVNSTLGLLLSFDLSAGDTVTMDTRFEVSPVPVPGAAWLFGSGLIAMLGFRKKSG